MKPHRYTFVVVLVFVCISAKTSFAQPPPDRIFGYLDRNRDGRLDEGEMARLPSSMRDRLAERGIRLDRPISRDDFIRRASGQKPSKKEKKARVRVTLALQEKYLDRDHDGDGQISLHEWKRSAYAEFFSIDRNGDLVITPKELAHAESAGITISESSKKPAPAGSAVVSSASVKSTSSSSKSKSRTSSTSKPSSSKSSESSKSIDMSEKSYQGRIARFVFKRIDKDKDGKIGADEWKSSSTRERYFEPLKITLETPADLQKFLDAYAKVAAAKKR